MAWLFAELDRQRRDNAALAADLAEAIGQVVAGGIVIDPRVAGAALGRTEESPGSDDPLAMLTRAERAVAEQVATDRTNAEIAAHLVLAQGTVKNHVSALLRKLQMRDRTALALLLHQLGMGTESVREWQ